MPRNYYVSGEWNVICDSCGKKIKAHEAKQRWDGLIVCPNDFEMRQPQDFVKARADKITVPFTRPRPTDIFTNVVYICTSDGKTGITNLATAGCSIAGHTQNAIIYPENTAIANYAITNKAVAGVSYING